LAFLVPLKFAKALRTTKRGGDRSTDL